MIFYNFLIYPLYSDNVSILNGSASEIVSFPHPVDGSTVQYLVLGGKLLELQVLCPNPRNSWFVDNTIMKNGSLYVATRFDVLFLLLPLLEKSKSNFSPLPQILSNPDFPKLCSTLLK